MAATRTAGFDGSITLPTGVSSIINTWSASITQVISETSGFTDSFRNYLGGIMGMRWNANGTPQYGASGYQPLPDSTDTLAMSRTGASGTFTVATGCSYAGTTLVESLDITSNKLGDATTAYSGVISGTITQTWAET